MLGQHAGRQAQGLLRIAGAVGPDFHNQLIEVGDLAHTGTIHRVVDLEDGGVDAVHRQGADVVLLNQRLLVLLSRNITAALVKGQLHDQLSALAQGGNVPLGVQDLEVVAALDGAGSDLAGADGLHADGLGGFAVDLGSDAFEVQDDFGDILTHALDGGELMHHTVDLDAGDSHTGQRGQKHTTQAVAQGRAEAALEGLDDELTVAAIRGKGSRFDLGAFDLHHKNPPC